MRLIFMGTPEFSVPALHALHAVGHEIACVYTQPPRPAGRGKKPRPSAVHQRADALGLPVHCPERFSASGATETFAGNRADIAVVVAYGLILPRAVLDAPRLGCLHIHASLLPRWRGAAPIHRAIMAGDRETGVCIMRMEAGLDTGPVLLREALTIGAEETTGTLHDRLSPLGARMIGEALARHRDLSPQPQPEEGVTYAHKIDKAEAAIDWTRPATELKHHVRGMSPWPRAFAFVPQAKGEPLRLVIDRVAAVDGAGAPGEVLEAAERLVVAAGEGALEVVDVQPAGKRRMAAGEWLRGAKLAPGATLS